MKDIWKYYPSISISLNFFWRILTIIYLNIILFICILLFGLFMMLKIFHLVFILGENMLKMNKEKKESLLLHKNKYYQTSTLFIFILILLLSLFFIQGSWFCWSFHASIWKIFAIIIIRRSWSKRNEWRTSFRISR